MVLFGFEDKGQRQPSRPLRETRASYPDHLPLPISPVPVCLKGPGAIELLSLAWTDLLTSDS